jgi:hypothetical protein
MKIVIRKSVRCFRPRKRGSVVRTNVRPALVELWKRIDEGRSGYIHTKAEACRLTGCSLRWAEKIVAGTANGSEASTRRKP